MTALVERVEVKAPATVLRRVECDAKDAAIMCAVLRGAKTYREISEVVGISKGGTLMGRVTGVYNDGRSRRVGGGLIARGYVCAETQIFRTLRPGPKLAGIDHDWPLELVEVDL
jgi:hypothetical protein